MSRAISPMSHLRIVRDNHLGYEVQEWSWTSMKYKQCKDYSKIPISSVNTHSSVYDAEQFIRNKHYVKYTAPKLPKVVKYIKN